MKNFNNNHLQLYTIIIISIIGLIIWSMTMVNPSGKNLAEPNDAPKRDYSIVKIDGCEYIEIGYMGDPSYNLVHKGNCSNPFHQHK